MNSLLSNPCHLEIQLFEICFKKHIEQQQNYQLQENVLSVNLVDKAS